MKHASFTLSDARPLGLSDLRLAEARLVAMLRLWGEGAAGQEQVWNGLCAVLGSNRARNCLSAFEDVLRLLRRHGWRALTVLPSEVTRLSEDEAVFARFVLTATEQDRDTAYLDASFLVSPAGILPLILAASRAGLPLLCEESRCRLHEAMRPA
ncbi:hypothetical protein [Puniceibacterium sediminis]|uniref:Uncharacterized protein n=1 Tax=Puniceibacterium sediminis TaxID=1608407 RepID=A0A238VUI5_9RHOB|nr:hypothetical protein [Puniceibacterium sediminis]SNR37985.1 hypothetical protein SAMN06265370_103184 [Puniceibacterium sediminis]